MTLTNDELKREVEEVFGVKLTDEQVEVAKGRLPTMFENVRLLAGWSRRLGATGPAQVLEVVEAPARKAGDHV